MISSKGSSKNLAGDGLVAGLVFTAGETETSLFAGGEAGSGCTDGATGEPGGEDFLFSLLTGEFSTSPAVDGEAKVGL